MICLYLISYMYSLYLYLVYILYNHTLWYSYTHTYTYIIFISMYCVFMYTIVIHVLHLHLHLSLYIYLYSILLLIQFFHLYTSILILLTWSSFRLAYDTCHMIHARVVHDTERYGTIRTPYIVPLYLVCLYTNILVYHIIQ